jgi:sec-independent protein translocase protein TatB
MGEGKILLLMVLALVVLGPEKLPKLAADIGRWVGRARGMARQLTQQLEQEVRVDQLLKEQRATAAAAPRPQDSGGFAAAVSETAPADVSPAVPAVSPPVSMVSAVSDDPTFSHAHGPGELAPDYPPAAPASDAPPPATPPASPAPAAATSPPPVPDR